MPALHVLRNLFRNVWRRDRAERDLDAEVSAHLDLLTAEKIQQGMDPAEARRSARIELGGVEQVKEEVRAARAGAWLETLWQDVCFGARQLRRNPGFTAVAVLTLALGIGASSALYSVVDGAFLHPFIYKNANSFTAMVARFPHKQLRSLLFSVPEYLDVKNRNHTLEHVGAERSALLDLSSGDTPEYVHGAYVTADEFVSRGIPPLLGRVFSEAEDRPGGPPVMVLAYSLWTRRFASDPAIVGKTIRLSGQDYTVLGVMPYRYRLLGGEFFLPAQLDLADTDRSHRFLYVTGQIRQGVSLEQTKSDLRQLAQAMEHEQGAAVPEYAGWTLEPGVVRDLIVGNLKPALFALMGAVALVLLIISANLANLLLARGTVRRAELALRLVHGASRGRIVRQLLTESVLISLLGSAAGLALVYGSIHALVGLIPPEFIATEAEIHMSAAVVVFAMLTTAAVTILFGLGPAWQAARCSPAEAFKASARSVAGDRGATFTRGVLVAAEMALAMVVLIGAGLMIRSYRQVASLPLGFRNDHTLTMRVPLPETSYPRAAQVEQFFRSLLERVRALPGLEDAALTSFLPMEEWDFDAQDFAIEGRPVEKGGALNADESIVSPGYFRTMGIRLIEGRAFTEGDDSRGLPVAVINQTMARLYWPTASPLNQRIVLSRALSRSGRLGDPDPGGPALTIVGVVEDVRQRPDILFQMRPQIYLSYWQNVSRIRDMAVAIRTAGAPTDAAPAVRAQIQALDPQQPVYRLQDMQTIVDNGMGPRRLSLVLLALFAAMALFLVIVGLYGVIAYSVARRTHEIGVRMALGAYPRDVLRMLLGQAAKVTACGVASGVLCAFVAMRLAASQFYGVSPVDPLAFGGVSAVLAAVAFAASYLPARRAMRVDPLVALRYE